MLEKQLKKGTRIVSHDFEFPLDSRKKWRPSRTTAKAAAIRCTSTGSNNVRPPRLSCFRAGFDWNRYPGVGRVLIGLVATLLS